MFILLTFTIISQTILLLLSLCATQLLDDQIYTFLYYN